MKIRNIDGLSGSEIRAIVADGGKFVTYKYAISIVVMTFNRGSDIYFIKPYTSDITPGLGCLFTSLFLGWWGIPWGPIYTIGNIYKVLNGGTDITNEVMSHINQNDPDYGTGNAYNIPGQTPGNSYNVPNQNNNTGYNVPGNQSNTGGNGNYNIPR